MSTRPKRQTAAQAQAAIEADLQRRKNLTEAQRKAEDEDSEDDKWAPGDPLNSDEDSYGDSETGSYDDEDDEDMDDDSD